MTKISKITFSAIFSAIGVVCSAFYIPIGAAKCFPIQHLLNVLAGMFLGPVYAVCMAFVTSFIRLLLGTGTFLAFPGSMCGALLCGILFKHTQRKSMAFVGEVIGTGIFGSLAAYAVATLFMSRTVAIFAFVIPFGISSLVGAALSLIILKAMHKIGILNKLKMGNV